MQGPPQLREGPSSLWARAHRAGQAVCQRVPPRTSHCHTACTPPCPIIAIIRLRPGRPFPWASLYIIVIMQTGAGPSCPEAPWNPYRPGRRQRLRPAHPHRGIGPPAGWRPLPALLTGTTPTASGTRSQARVFGAARGPPSNGVPCSERLSRGQPGRQSIRCNASPWPAPPTCALKRQVTSCSAGGTMKSS